METRQKNVRVSELYGDYWFNSEPISIRANQGNVVIMDFWDYCCVNCIRAIPYLRDWYRKYREYGLIVIGVHTPEFRFGKRQKLVEEAIEKLQIDYPVVTDNEGIIWSGFGNRVWPTKYLIDKDGFIRYVHEGEGSYDQIERAIQSLLAESGIRGELPQLTASVRESDEPEMIPYKASNEIHLGYIRGTIGNVEGYNPESKVDYSDLGLYLPGRFYVQGKWIVERESVKFVGEKDEAGYVVMRYQASEVYVVLENEGSERSTVFVEQDGVPLDETNRGDDVTLESEKSVIVLDAPRVYHVVKNKEFGEHTLKLLTTSPGLSLYTVSFITSAIPNLVYSN